MDLLQIEHVMTKNPVACEANEPVENVARLMRDKGVGCVVLLRNGRVAGIVTDRQLTVGVLAEGLAPDTPVEDVMTPSPATLYADETIFAAVDTMRSAKVARRIPVINHHDELVGVVSVSDIAVVAKDLLDAVMLEETHHALEEAKILTGAKRIVKDIRRPTKMDRLNREQDTRAVTETTPPGTSTSGGAGRPANR